MLDGYNKHSVATTWNNIYIFAVGIIVHLLYLSCVFDVYFSSPLVHHVHQIHLAEEVDAPAKRVVVFVADGLRADRLLESFTNKSQYKALHLRDIVEKRGSWGVSRTHVPTETRPGHVAILSGFYEDIASITKGWKENAVEFDTIFNQSRYTWAWGARDVVAMFTQTPGIQGRIFADMFSQDIVDFSSKNASKLDHWVLSNALTFLDSSAKNEELYNKLHEDKVVFFLHLLATDVLGHGLKPHSTQYKANIKSVDRIVERFESRIEKFYNYDGKTAYIFTADHGMTDWGSHGSGFLAETQTPLIAWGSGVEKAETESDPSSIKGIQLPDWGDVHVKRKDVEQADVCALTACLLGVTYPVNSVGKLPTAYLNASPRAKALYVLQNSQQIMTQYLVKEEAVKKKSLWFHPFSFSEHIGENSVKDILEDIKKGLYSQAIAKAERSRTLSLEGLQYYHKYDRLYLSVIMAVGFLGWVINMVFELVRETKDVASRVLFKQGRRKYSPLMFGVLLCVTIVGGILYLTKAPLMHYCYCLIPFPVWYRVASHQSQIVAKLRTMTYCGTFTPSIFRGFATFIIIELISLSFFYRATLSVLLIMGSLLTCVLVRRFGGDLFHVSNIAWIISLLLLSIFPLLPVISGNENYALVTLAGLVTGAVGMSYTFVFPPKALKESIILILTASVVTCTVLRLHTARSIHHDQGLPPLNQLLSWTSIFLLPLLPLKSAPHIIDRLLSIFLSFLALYILMSVNYESLFFISLSFTLTMWVVQERRLMEIKYARSFIGIVQKSSDFQPNTGSIPEPDTFDYFRIALEYIFFIFIAFFGTGNISSINSFDPASVYCFLTIFDPFVMGLILMLKVAIPFVVVSCFFNAIRTVVHIDVRRIFVAVLICTDLMAFQFFFLIKDEGSWQDIGTSLSHFVIVLGFVLFMFPLFEVGAILIRNVKSDPLKLHDL